MNYEELASAILKDCPRLNRSMFSKGSMDSTNIKYTLETVFYTTVNYYIGECGRIHVNIPYITGGTYRSDPIRVYESYSKRLSNALNTFLDLLDAHKAKQIQDEQARLLRVKYLQETVADRLAAIHGDHFMVSEDGYRCNLHYMGHCIYINEDKASMYLGDTSSSVPIPLVMKLIQTVAAHNLIEGA